MSDPATWKAIAAIEERISRIERWDTARISTGTWTPTFVGTTAAGTFTYTAATSGTYIRIDQYCIAVGRVGITAITGAPTGSMRIGGLPFTVVNANRTGSTSFAYISNFNYTAAALALTGLPNGSSTQIALYESFDNAAAVTAPAANFTNVNCDLIFTCIFIIA